MKKLSLLALVVLILASCQDKESLPPQKKTFSVKTFESVRHAFGEGLSQSAEDVFDFPTDPTMVERITMIVKLRCPQGGCNAWDMFANIRVWDSGHEQWLELGRYITPYGVDNAQTGRGFMVDVTDFKSILTGQVKLRSFVEVWGNYGWLVSVDFEITEGSPEYAYFALSPVLDYADWSLAGVPYGEDHNFTMERTITLPSHTKETTLRTIITGWGHATPVDPDGRPCAEWCFRTHHILINDQTQFSHEMKGLECDKNPVQPQNGNWAPDRAGWCPGMAVPVRQDIFSSPMSGMSFTYLYQLEEWTNTFQSTTDNKHAYYAISSYVVVKSNEPIEAPLVD